MIARPRHMAKPVPAIGPRSTWAAYAACAWALVFAVISLYWAVGGTAGTETIGPALTDLALARDPGFVALLWATVTLKVLAALLALTLVRSWGRVFPRWLLLMAAWGAVVIMAVYEGAASMVQHGLMVAGVIRTPEGLGATAARWHLLLWDPWWLLGGILFAVAAESYRRTARDDRSPTTDYPEDRCRSNARTTS